MLDRHCRSLRCRYGACSYGVFSYGVFVTVSGSVGELERRHLWVSAICKMGLAKWQS
ncbi:hypothetical protein D083_3059 [Dickeya solani RNS 08.23.3.1.A]|nr:hypothetical protein D083_3059 [Dickeya solani RNS 08.23.3.1.A]